MKIENDNNKIILKFKPKNDGKFRFKIRDNNFDFGESFATATKLFSDKVYLEWQIGYDAIVIDVENGKKETTLKNKFFIGANKKKKYLYELSEIIYFLFKNKSITEKIIKDLIKEIESYNNYIGDKSIIINKDLKDIKINNFSFKETITTLPTFFYYTKTDNSQIEIAIQKQQYATGVQPMVYYTFPINTFKNGKDFISKTSKDIKDDLIYEINNKNVNNFIDLLKIFGMCSKSHQFDILEILKLILIYK